MRHFGLGMTVTKASVLKQIKETLLIGLFGGLLQGYLSRKGFLTGQNCEADFFIFGFAASMWISLWKGNEALSNLLDLKYSWLESPGKRFLVGMASMIIYSLSAAFLVYSLFYGLIRGQDVIDNISKIFNYFLISALSITTLISTFVHGYAFLRSWRQSEINLERLKKEKLASQYESLKSQLNPHFLFNSLNVLTALVYDDQDKAAKFIGELSKVYRYVLDVQKLDVVQLSEELKFVESFFYLQKIRFGDNLHLEIDLPNASLHGNVPPLALQLLIENAIKHNEISEAHQLYIAIKCIDEVLIVTNNINKMHFFNQEQESNGMGLENIKERYKHLVGKEVDIDNSGDVFTVKLPLLAID